MFTGLIADIGTLEAVDASGEGGSLRVRTGLAGELSRGDSIAVNGVCLTVAGLRDGGFEADVMNQTLELTSLAGLAAGSGVNLEPALRAGDPLGGHIVQGHVDGTGEVLSVSEDGFARRVEISLPGALARYVAEHGSIALDGVSLTVAALRGDGVEVSLVPETLERTTLSGLEVGRPVNIEVDLLARYAERLLQGFPERRRDEDA
jgi:riboflavin synthase